MTMQDTYEQLVKAKIGSAESDAVSISIVNFNAGDVLSECVGAALDSTVPVEIIVVDNGSTDHSLRALRKRFEGDKRLTVIETGRNLGFAKATNIGLRLATKPFCLLLNPDCILKADTLAGVIRSLRLQNNAGMAGCMIRNPDGSEQAGARRTVPTPWRAIVRVLHLDQWLPRYLRPTSFLQHHEPVPNGPISVEAISGAFMLVRHELLSQVGLLDEGYFMHCEDLDWCMRFRSAGWTIAFVPDAEVVHYKGACSKKRPVFVEWHKHRGMVRFYRKHFRQQYPLPLMFLVFTGVWARFSLTAGRIQIERLFLRRSFNGHPDATLLPNTPSKMTFQNETYRPAEWPDVERSHWLGQQVLVTGGTGFIGRYLIQALVAAGAEVKILERPKSESSGYNRRRSDKIERRYGDLTEPDSLVGVCDGVSTIFHLAGYAHADDKSKNLTRSMHWRVSVVGTQALLDQACKAGVSRLIFISTVKAMGEGGDSQLDETSPIAPKDNYGKAKCESERIVLAAGQRCGIHTVVLRLPMVYGRANAGNLSRMITAIRRKRFPPLPKVNNRRSMVHAEDVVQAMMLAAVRTNANGQTYLITDDEVYSAHRIYESICAAIGYHSPNWNVPTWALNVAGRIGDILYKLRLPVPLTTDALRKLLGSAWYSCEKAKRDLGYKPRWQLEDALPEMVSDTYTKRPSNVI